MPRYVDISVLTQEDFELALIPSDCLAIVNGLDEEDVKKVVYGYWKKREHGNPICSICGSTAFFGCENFCCVCGADMRGKLNG